MCASESCGSSHNAQPIICRYVTLGFFCHSKINPLPRPPVSSRGAAEALNETKGDGKYKGVNKVGTSMRKGKLMGKIFGIALVLVMIVGMLGSSPALVGKVEASPTTIYVPDNYPTIQAAVNAASPGDTIIVRDGTYTENVNVYKDHLTIQSENGAEVTIVQAANPNDHVFEVTADYVNISRFTVKGVGYGGIYLNGSYSNHVEHCNISANVIQGNSDGIHLRYSSSNTLVANAASSNGRAIYLLLSPNNILNNNTISNNSEGIKIHLSPNNILTNNAMSDNNRNLDIFGGGYSEFVQNIDTSNTINGMPVRYLVDEKNMTIDSSWDVGYLGIVNCDNIIARDLTLTNNGQGVLLVNSFNSRIENINAIDNYHGIFVFSSSSNALAGNLISNNNLGVSVVISSDNILADNVIDSNVYGLWLQSSPSTLTDNNLSNNNRNLIVQGSNLSDYLSSIDTSNKINGKPIYYLIDEEGLIIDSSQDVGYLGLVNCNNMLVKDLNFTNNGQGLLLAYTNNSEIGNIDASNNRFGIYLYCSSGNTLRDSNLSNNTYDGIRLYYSSSNVLINNTASGCFPGIGLYGDSSSNIIYLNNFIDNVNGVYSSGSTNTWNSPEEITYTYNGNTYTSYLGNYWSDYTGSDTNGDGIGETSYPINSDADNYPLVDHFESYIAVPVAILEVYAYENEFSRSWTRDSVTDLPMCNSVIIYDISNVGSEVATNVQVSIEIDGNTFAQYTIPTLSEGASYIAGFTLSTNYDSSKYVEIIVSTADSSDTYGFLLDATLPRAAGYMTWQEDIGPLVKLFITPADSVIEEISSGLSDWKEIRSWVRDNHEYIKDSEAYGVPEYFQLPRETVEIDQGDCEDFAILMVSLLRAKGWKTDEAYVVVGYQPIWLGGHSHAWVLLKEDPDWLYVDPRGTIVDDGLLPFYDPVAAFNDNYFGEPIVVSSYSPIDIIVTDPDGLIISKQLNEIPSAWYSEIDLDEDGELVDEVVILDKKSGDYYITVVPEPGASPVDTYTLKVSANGMAITIAENVQISDIPSEGYRVRSTETEIIQIIPATIDFDPDTLNLRSRDRSVTVYIELPPGYDVSQIDISSISLNGTIPALTKPIEVGDYDSDGIPDLMVKFDGAAVKGILTPGGQVEITITGEVAGIGFDGSDTIRVISR